MQAVTLLGSEDCVKTVSDTGAKISDVVSVGSWISDAHGHNSGVSSSKGGGRVTNRRRGSGDGSIARSVRRRLVVVTRKEVLDDSVLNEIMDERENGTTSDTLVNHVQRSLEHVANTRLQAVTLKEGTNCIGTLLVTVTLGSNLRVGITGLPASGDRSESTRRGCTRGGWG